MFCERTLPVSNQRRDLGGCKGKGNLTVNGV